MNFKINWDGLGIITSIACAIHCAVLPLILSTLPLFGINIIHNPYFEWGMILLALCIGTYSLYHGYIKHHHSLVPISLFISGMFFLFAKQAFHTYETMLLVPAVVLIVTAHYYNYRMCHRSKCSSPHHVH
ncbi:MAG: MerC domain-containing protein [Bacteroidetes bacterium]|nr:MerC domain-containing protein [Bacteroidota bacterium]